MNRQRHNLEISPGLRSWIDNCLVPIMVKEFLAGLSGEKSLDDELTSVAELSTDSTAPNEVIQ